MKQLIWIQIIFFLTYFTRFLSDLLVVPKVLKEDIKSLVMCNAAQTAPSCVSFKLMIYYIWTSFIWDFLPLALLFRSHYSNFS